MKAYGIDFGTTNSLVSLWHDSQVEILPLETDDSPILRSVLYIHPEVGHLVGKQAIDAYLQDVARGEPLKLVEKFTGKYIKVPKPMGIGGYRGEIQVPQVVMVEESNRGRLLQSLKSVLTTNYSGTELFGTFYTLEDLLTLLLSDIKTRADKLVGENIESVVIGRPVKYVGKDNEKLALDRMTEVAKRAGFKKINFEFEPTGAALSYGQNGKSLIFDFGGGTLDISIVEFPSGEVLSVTGAPIGGDLLNTQIIKAHILKYFGANVTFGHAKLAIPDSLMRSLENWYSISLLKTKSFLDSVEYIYSTANDKKPIQALKDLVIYNLGFMLFEEIDRVKKSLSLSQEEVIGFHQQSISIDEIVSRSDFEESIDDLMARIDSCVNEALALAKLETAEIDQVVMTGGSSQIPIVRQRLQDKFGISKVSEIDVFTSVVRGLGIRAGQIG